MHRWSVLSSWRLGWITMKVWLSTKVLFALCLHHLNVSHAASLDHLRVEMRCSLHTFQLHYCALYEWAAGPHFEYRSIPIFICHSWSGLHAVISPTPCQSRLFLHSRVRSFNSTWFCNRAFLNWSFGITINIHAALIALEMWLGWPSFAHLWTAWNPAKVLFENTFPQKGEIYIQH